tara:strand:- start:68 stop:487 length:420 start_codon:yes stop_codon:yes gene_type:complete
MNCANIFDWLKHINQYKTPTDKFSDKDWEVFNSYMIHRFLSMDNSNIELVNEIQEILPTDKKKIYSIYKEFIPKNNKWNKYIKSKIKQPNKDLINYIKDYYECSLKEAKEYIGMLGSIKINRILHNIGLDKKEIKSLLK